jgi:hypothetical protein
MSTGFRRGPAFIALALAVTTVSSDAGAALSDPCFTTNQTRLLCTYFFRNAGAAVETLGANVWHWLNGRKSEKACLLEAFERSPDLWDNLKVTQGRRLSTAENQLMVFNTEEGLDPVIRKTKGVCWGNATMKTYLTRLSFFDPKGEFEALPPFSEGSDAWIRFYLEKMNRLTRGEPEIVPGFANLRDFSDHPALKPWFVRRQVELWAERAARLKNLIYRQSSRDFTTEEALTFIRDVEERLAMGYNPKIMFDENSHRIVKGEEDSLHVVLATAVHHLKNNKVAIEVIDDKKPFPKNSEILIINLRGGPKRNRAMGLFMPWRVSDPKRPRGPGNGIDMGGGHVNQFRITPENDREAMQMTLNLAAFCEKRPEVCEALGDRTVQKRPRPQLPIPGKPWSALEYL